jgi:tight adherence protein C
MVALENYQPIWLVIMPLLGFMFPSIWLSDTRKKRDNAVIRTLPVYLDFITMCVEGGLNLQGALGQAMEKAPAGPLKNEFSVVLRDLRAGLSRADALRRMAERLDIQEITSFVSSIIQAEKMGASLGTVLRVQSDQRRNERFQRAEKLAMEAPIKLVGPLIMFIFPVTFIVLGFPIVMKFFGEGML